VVQTERLTAQESPRTHTQNSRPLPIQGHFKYILSMLQKAN